MGQNAIAASSMQRQQAQQHSNQPWLGGTMLSVSMSLLRLSGLVCCGCVAEMVDVLILGRP
jgi:hypothetical protein